MNNPIDKLRKQLADQTALLKEAQYRASEAYKFVQRLELEAQSIEQKVKLIQSQLAPHLLDGYQLVTGHECAIEDKSKTKYLVVPSTFPLIEKACILHPFLHHLQVEIELEFANNDSHSGEIAHGETESDAWAMAYKLYL